MHLSAYAKHVKENHTMKRKHVFPFILGCCLILLQILVCIGNANSTFKPQISFATISSTLHTVAYLLGYYVVGIIGTIVLFLTLFSINNNTHSSKRKFNINDITKIAVLTAIASVMMLFEIPLWFAPGFYKLDLSELVILMGGFALGPGAAILIEFLKNLINTLLNGTTTAYIGEFANFITGCAFVVPAALIYKYHKNKKGAIISMIVGSLSLALIGSLLNYFVLIPAFSRFYNLPIENIIGMGAAVNPLVSDLKTLVIFAVAPFNLVKGVICSVFSLILYKHVSKILHI